jgi:hypothetical protein
MDVSSPFTGNKVALAVVKKVHSVAPKHSENVTHFCASSLEQTIRALILLRASLGNKSGTTKCHLGRQMEGCLDQCVMGIFVQYYAILYNKR